MEEKFYGKFQVSHTCISLDGRISTKETAPDEFLNTPEEITKFLVERKTLCNNIKYKILNLHIAEWDSEKRKYVPNADLSNLFKY